MPRVKEYKNSKGNNHHKKSAAKHTVKGGGKHTKTQDSYEVGEEEMENHESETNETSTKRRPGREEPVEYIDTIEASDSDEASEDEAEEIETPRRRRQEKSQEDEDKIRIEFFGSEMIREKLPEVFDAAESIATEWKKDGDFSNIELPNPVLKMAATEGLKRAKKVEKKLEEKGVFLMARMGVEFVKSKLKNK